MLYLVRFSPAQGKSCPSTITTSVVRSELCILPKAAGHTFKRRTRGKFFGQDVLKKDKLRLFVRKKAHLATLVVTDNSAV